MADSVGCNHERRAEISSISARPKICIMPLKPSKRCIKLWDAVNSPPKTIIPKNTRAVHNKKNWFQNKKPQSSVDDEKLRTYISPLREFFLG